MKRFVLLYALSCAATPFSAMAEGDTPDPAYEAALRTVFAEIGKEVDAPTAMAKRYEPLLAPDFIATEKWSLRFDGKETKLDKSYSKLLFLGKFGGTPEPGLTRSFTIDRLTVKDDTIAEVTTLETRDGIVTNLKGKQLRLKSKSTCVHHMRREQGSIQLTGMNCVRLESSDRVDEISERQTKEPL